MVDVFGGVVDVVKTAGLETWGFSKTVVNSGAWAVSNVVSSIIHFGK